MNSGFLSPVCYMIIKSVDLAGLEPALFCFTQMRYLSTRAVSQLTRTCNLLIRIQTRCQLRQRSLSVVRSAKYQFSSVSLCITIKGKRSWQDSNLQSSDS
jgi:hypothetical protein